MSQEYLQIRGARVHNLKNVHLRLPHNRLIVVTGVSGSGKSSLAFDTVYAEGQRRYVESMSAYARQFLERITKPDVDEIEGIAAPIAIRQKNTTRVTERKRGGAVRKLGPLAARPGIRRVLEPGGSAGDDGRVAVLAGDIEQRSVEGDHCRIALLGIGEQVAIANPLRCAFRRERRCRSPECGVQAAWFGIEFHAWVVEPSFVHRPSLLEGQRLFAHDGFVREKAQQADLGIAREDEPRLAREQPEPMPGIRIV